MTKWRRVALVGVLSGALTACAPKAEEGGGGGAPQPVASERLPQSNNVNPTPGPDRYIDHPTTRREPTP